MILVSEMNGSWSLRRMNDARRGGQYKFPRSLMKWLTLQKQLVDYRRLRMESLNHILLVFPELLKAPLQDQLCNHSF